MREQVDWATAAEPVIGPVAGQRDGIEDVVLRTRGDRLHRVLRQVYEAAGPDLTFDVLARRQAEVLGVPSAGFRVGDAYAKGGRERYGLEPDTRPRFEACLAEATDPAVPLPSRAARVYLDVAFVHPFPDGNARAAMLCLAHVLRRDRVTIDLAAPVLSVVRRAADRAGTLDLIRLIEVLIAGTRRRASREDAHR